MSLASDQNFDPKHLSRISRSMLELREVVFEEWERRVRASVKGAKTLSHPVLVNTLPTMYDNIVEALTPQYPRTSAGVATRRPGERLDALLRRADAALYAAKAGGRDRVVAAD